MPKTSPNTHQHDFLVVMLHDGPFLIKVTKEHYSCCLNFWGNLKAIHWISWILPSLNLRRNNSSFMDRCYGNGLSFYLPKQHHEDSSSFHHLALPYCLHRIFVEPTSLDSFPTNKHNTFPCRIPRNLLSFVQILVDFCTWMSTFIVVVL